MPQSNLQSLTSSLSPLRERDLFHLWIGQRFPQEALVTVRGERLRAVYRGRPGRGAGPDFRDAIIAAPEGLLQGDVELHVRSGDFRRHGHHLDPAYDGLALHVVFEHDGDADETELACGRRVPVVALAGWLERREREIRGWLARPALWEEPCRSAVARLGAAETGATLDRLGDMRFRQKAAAFGAETRNSQLATRNSGGGLRTQNSELRTPNSILWQELMEGLGYGGARELMREAARRAPWPAVARALAPLGARERAREALRLLEKAARGLEAAGASLRPGNRPERRLRGAAQLAARFSPDGPVASLLPYLAVPPREARRSLLAALTVPGLIGRGRALELLANAVLPFAAAYPALEPAAEAVYRSLPLPARYGNVSHLHEAVGADVPPDFRRQQGMLYLLGQYCTRGGCGKCPLS